jgi:UDP:flavonoid glycosyltransferase YjiC (YdhE family)
MCLEEQQAGVCLTMRQVMARPQILSDAINTVLQNADHYRESLRLLQEDLLHYDPVKVAADEIEGVISGTIGLKGDFSESGKDP